MSFSKKCGSQESRAGSAQTLVRFSFDFPVAPVENFSQQSAFFGLKSLDDLEVSPTTIQNSNILNLVKLLHEAFKSQQLSIVWQEKTITIAQALSALNKLTKFKMLLF